ncbi:vacuolar membrane protein-domain-containing protein [Bisporella sp. PMI_857]|nr:vacuolar membrane protein-domain-containing protein [Bisporella sp. PMI_857]
MLPPPGFEPTSVAQSVSPTLLAIATTSSSYLRLGVDVPTATLSSALAISTIASSHPDDTSPDNGECRLLGPFAIFVQGALGLLALLALVYKRWRERPQRPLKIWFFDASKQVVGSVLVHVANLLMSMLSSGQFSISVEPSTVAETSLGGVVRRMVDDDGHYSPNPCSFYLLNLAIDTTVGIPILIVLLRIITALFLYTPVGSPPQSIASGNYGNPPRAWWWVKQSVIYFMGLMGMKFCVLIIFLVLPWISRVGDWALRWTEGNEALQVAFVMFIFPVIMNATQYYIIDSFIKNQKPEGHERIRDEEDDEAYDDSYEDPHSGSSDEINSDDEDDEVVAKGSLASQVTTDTVKKSKKGVGSHHLDLKSRNKDYDPMLDGENSPTVGSSSTAGR